MMDTTENQLSRQLAKEWAALLMAYAEGKTIQHRMADRERFTGRWVDSIIPPINLLSAAEEWRIKPEPEKCCVWVDKANGEPFIRPENAGIKAQDINRLVLVGHIALLDDGTFAPWVGEWKTVEIPPNPTPSLKELMGIVRAYSNHEKASLKVDLSNPTVTACIGINEHAKAPALREALREKVSAICAVEVHPIL